MRRHLGCLTLLLALAVLAGVATTVRVVAPRARRAARLRELVRKVQADPKDSTSPYALLDYEEADAVLALLDSSGRGSGNAIEAIELFALEPEPRDPRVRAALEALARSPEREVRFWGLYLLDELDAPTHAREPAGFAASHERVVYQISGALRSIEAAARMPIVVPQRLHVLKDDPDYVSGEARPWRALVRWARGARCRVAVEGERVVLVPLPHGYAGGSSFDDATSQMRRLEIPRFLDDPPGATLPPIRLEVAPPALLLAPLPGDMGRSGLPAGIDAAKALRALAAVNGVTLERRDETTFLAREALPRAERVARLVTALGSDPDSARTFAEWLVAFEEPEALLGLLDWKPKDEDDERWADLVEEAGILHAATGAPDPRVRERLAALAAADDPRRKTVALALLHELREPRLPKAPPRLAGAGWIVADTLEATLAAVASATGVAVVVDGNVDASTDDFGAPAWRALARLGARGRWRLRVDGERVTLGEDTRELLPELRAWHALVPRPEAKGLDGDGDRALRALATATGWDDLDLAGRVAKLCEAARAHPEGAGDLLQRVVALDAPEAVLGLAELVAVSPRDDVQRALREAVELEAAGDVDPRVRATLARVASSATTADARFAAHYALEELAAPAFPRPTWFPREGPVDLPNGDFAEAVAPVVSLTGCRFEIPPRHDSSGLGPIHARTPWRALVRHAQRGQVRYDTREGVVTLKSAPPSFDVNKPSTLAKALGRAVVVAPDVRLPRFQELSWIHEHEPAKALRALARMSGAEVRERTDGAFEVTAR